jgi:hypothetical protein
MTAIINYPAAEAFARRMRLPLTACPVTRAPVLDIECAVWILEEGGVPAGTPPHAAALMVLEARAAELDYGHSGFVSCRCR